MEYWNRGQILFEGFLFKTGGGQNGKCNDSKPATQRRRYLRLVAHPTTGSKKGDLMTNRSNLLQAAAGTHSLRYFIYYSETKTSKAPKGLVELTRETRLRFAWRDDEDINQDTVTLRLIHPDRVLFLKADSSAVAHRWAKELRAITSLLTMGRRNDIVTDVKRIITNLKNIEKTRVNNPLDNNKNNNNNNNNNNSSNNNKNKNNFHTRDEDIQHIRNTKQKMKHMNTSFFAEYKCDRPIIADRTDYFLQQRSKVIRTKQKQANEATSIDTFGHAYDRFSNKIRLEISAKSVEGRLWKQGELNKKWLLRDVLLNFEGLTYSRDMKATKMIHLKQMLFVTGDHERIHIIWAKTDAKEASAQGKQPYRTLEFRTAKPVDASQRGLLREKTFERTDFSDVHNIHKTSQTNDVVNFYDAFNVHLANMFGPHRIKTEVQIRTPKYSWSIKILTDKHDVLLCPYCRCSFQTSKDLKVHVLVCNFNPNFPTIMLKQRLLQPQSLCKSTKGRNISVPATSRVSPIYQTPEDAIKFALLRRVIRHALSIFHSNNHELYTNDDKIFMEHILFTAVKTRERVREAVEQVVRLAGEIEEFKRCQVTCYRISSSRVLNHMQMCFLRDILLDYYEQFKLYASGSKNLGLLYTKKGIELYKALIHSGFETAMDEDGRNGKNSSAHLDANATKKGKFLQSRFKWIVTMIVKQEKLGSVRAVVTIQKTVRGFLSKQCDHAPKAKKKLGSFFKLAQFKSSSDRQNQEKWMPSIADIGTFFKDAFSIDRDVNNTVFDIESDDLINWTGHGNAEQVLPNAITGDEICEISKPLCAQTIQTFENSKKDTSELPPNNRQLYGIEHSFHNFHSKSESSFSSTSVTSEAEEGIFRDAEQVCGTEFQSKLQQQTYRNFISDYSKGNACSMTSMLSMASEADEGTFQDVEDNGIV